VHKRIPEDNLRKQFAISNDSISASAEEKKILLGEAQPYTFSEDQNEYLTFKKSVYDELDRKGLPSHATTFEVSMGIFGLGLYFLFYYLMVTTGYYTLAIAFGVTRALLSLCIGHPGSHFSLVKGEMNMKMFRMFSPFVLSDAAVWVPSHVISHHIETFVDTDLQDNYPLKRLHPSLKPYFFHRFQHIYVWFVYAVALPLWTAQDFIETTAMLITNNPMKRYYNAPQSVKLQVAVSLLFNLFFVYYIPFHQQGLGLVLAHTIPSSIWVVLSIMVNHEVDIHEHKSHDQEQGKKSRLGNVSNHSFSRFWCRQSSHMLFNWWIEFASRTPSFPNNFFPSFISN